MAWLFNNPEWMLHFVFSLIKFLLQVSAATNHPISDKMLHFYITDKVGGMWVINEVRGGERHERTKEKEI